MVEPILEITPEEVRAYRAQFLGNRLHGFLNAYSPEYCDAIRLDFETLDDERQPWFEAISRHRWFEATRIALGLYDYFRSRGLWKEIEEIWTALLRNAPDDPDYAAHRASLLSQLGTIASNRGKNETAVRCFGQCIALARELGWAQLEANARYELAVTQLHYGGYKGLHQLFTDALDASKRAGDRRLDHYVLGKYAELLAREGKLDQAAGLLEDSLSQWKHFESASDRMMSHTTMHVLGRIRLQQGRYGEAQELLEESLALKTRAGATEEGLSHTTCLLGEVYTAFGAYDKAEVHLISSIQGSLSLGDARYTALGRKALGALRFQQKRYGEAEAVLALAAADAKKIRNAELQFEAAVWRVSSALRSGRFKSAVHGLASALRAALTNPRTVLAYLRMSLNRSRFSRQGRATTETSAPDGETGGLVS